ncbi:MAG: CerR family C-terminal domain-containing protein [Alphaproteobacteria bacterium]|nr:CerR family C-terminal domain-containing protein [Alphaproteobacteria bacterium]
MAADSKSKLLLSAFEEFAKNGFFGASTRDIAARANINISSILYYFGGKKGIYTAALKNIVAVVNDMTADLTAQYQIVQKSENQQDAANLLKDFMKRFLMIICSATLSSDMKKVFLSEYSCPSDEFSILYDELIRPFHDKISTLLYWASAKKIPIKDCYFYIITLFSTFFVFISREDNICKIMEWDKTDSQIVEKLLTYTYKQIDFILSMFSQEDKK